MHGAGKENVCHPAGSRDGGNPNGEQGQEKEEKDVEYLVLMYLVKNFTTISKNSDIQKFFI